MTVRGRLLAAFAVVTAVVLVPAVYAAVRLAELRDIAVMERSRHASALLSLGRLEAALSDLDRFQRSFVAAPDPRLQQAVRRVLARMDEEATLLERSRYGEASVALLPLVAELRDRSHRIEELVARDSLGPATEAFVRLEPLLRSMEGRLVTVANSIDRMSRDDFVRARAISAQARRTTLLGIGAALAVAVILGFWTTGALTGPLGRLLGATRQVADGSFQAPQDLPYGREDEIGELSRSFRTMTVRLAELDRMKAEFVGVASHELKTPINVISGYIELIEEELTGELTAHQEEILHGIAEQARAMSRLVSRLMDISRLETGTYGTELEEIHTTDLITGVLRSFDVLAAGSQVELTADIDDSAPETLKVDVDLVRDEVLGNLVSNALKHTPSGGAVKIVVWGEGSEVVFEVSDTGPGISEEHRPHIFEKYYQAERSRAVGSGLGLAIAREMVEVHGGRIELVSGMGQGATFRVTLPVSPAPEDELPLPHSRRGPAAAEA